MKITHYDIVVVGAGISGATLAERFASIGKKVLVIEKRDHIGGNCFDYINNAGILVSKYGAHIFHTNSEEVWEYVNRFSKWKPYYHKVLAKVDDKLVPVPVNITTVNKIFGLNIKTEDEMKSWLEKNQIKRKTPKNGKEAAESKVGKVLYEKIFKNYTYKQWNKYPEELDAEVLNRIPVRTNFEDGYFNDKYQALPSKGYTKLFEKMLEHENIQVLLETDFFEIQKYITGYEKLFYTGPIDRYFDFKFSLKDKLEYRSIRFEWETLDQEFFQQNSVVNYPQVEDGNFTRIIEYKHFTGQKNSKTTISREYSVDATGNLEKYYPVPSSRNKKIYEKYKKEAEKLLNVYFVGRLANYKYFNMDEAFKNSLELFDKLLTQEPLTVEAGTGNASLSDSELDTFQAYYPQNRSSSGLKRGSTKKRNLDNRKTDNENEPKS
jgi:UDP-galactopyranose mutase